MVSTAKKSDEKEGFIQAFNSKNETLEKVIQLSSFTPDGVEYLKDRLKSVPKVLTEIDSVQNFISAINDFCDEKLEKASLVSGLEWLGHPDDENQKFREKVSMDMANLIKRTEGEIDFHFAIGPDTELVSAYLLDGEQLDDPALISATNRLFYNWLEENNYIRQNDIIYQTDDNGSILRDEHGNLVQAQVQELQELAQDENKGLAKYLQDFGLTEKVAPFPREFEVPDKPREEVQSQKGKQVQEHVATEKETHIDDQTIETPGQKGTTGA